MNPESNITLGISSCLLGNKVRFDGGHKHQRYISQTLGDYFTFKPICPEVEIGLGIPRPPIHLKHINDKIRAVNIKDTSLDYTDQLTQHAIQTIQTQLGDISGYIFKKDSPSCGMQRVKIYDQDGNFQSKDGIGIFTQQVLKHLPNLPVEEEGRLNDEQLRENFLMRIFVYHHWQQLPQPYTIAELTGFHAMHKYLLMAHNQQETTALGRLLANSKKSGDINATAQQYIDMSMKILAKPTNRKRQTNVLEHIMGYLSKHIDEQDKQELRRHIHDYREGKVPVLVPMTLLRHHFYKHPDDYIQQQAFMEPYPETLNRK